MALTIPPFNSLSDSELLATVRRLVTDERMATATLIASLAELDGRRLYLGEGCSSLFTYCTGVLHMSEHAAYARIEAARVARRFPVVLERLAEGAVTLTAVGLLAPHLTPANHHALLEAARHKSKREVQELVARIRPKADVPATVRKLPVPVSTCAAAAPPAASSYPAPNASTSPTASTSPAPIARRQPPSPSIQPLSPSRYKVQFTLNDEGLSLLHRAQALMRHRVPNGDVAVLMTEALKLLVDQLERTKLGATSRPHAKQRPCGPRSRTVPAAVRRAVWTRDEGRCAFEGTQGRCTETSFLEFHHVRPYADGGEAVVENIELRCRAHNQYEGERHFGSSLPWTARELSEGLEGWNSVRTEFHMAQHRCR